jgi:hypothetical protein
MALLTLILTHLEAPLVEAQLKYLEQVAPESRFAVCHGGERAEFDRLSSGSAVFIDDPSLRGPHFEKSINETLRVADEAFVRPDDAIDLIYLIEYDHLILSGDFERRLRDLAEASPAGLFAKAATRRNDSNWPQYLHIQGDARLNGFISTISRRPDPEARWGCLGTGILLRREAWDAFCAIPDPPPYYIEMFLPTVLYHLGFDILNIDAVSDFYRDVRWLPEFSLSDVLAAREGGRALVHPFKTLEGLERIGQATGSGRNSSSAARSG